MCEHGTEVILRVPIHADDSFTGEFRWRDKPVDACLADLVNALNSNGIYTRTSCCGHGKDAGQIRLHDGRVLLIGLIEELVSLEAVLEQRERYLEALKEIANEECTYVDCAAREGVTSDDDEEDVAYPYWDPQCAGEVCHSRRALLPQNDEVGQKLYSKPKARTA